MSVWRSGVTLQYRAVSLLSVSEEYLSTSILLQFVLLVDVILPGMFCWLWGFCSLSSLWATMHHEDLC